MIPIYPITEPICRQYIGRPVCAVLHDGTHYIGMLEEIRDGQLVINGYIPGPEIAEIYSKGKKKHRKSPKAQTSFFPGFGFNRFFFPFAALSLLFLLPFFAFPFFI
jgi:hypothetical protein